METINNNFSNHSIHPMQTDFWDAALDQQMLANYNQMFQSTDVYGSFEASSASSPSESSSPRTPSLSSSRHSSESRSGFPDKVERRREQNRQSQRAYRDRKEKHQRDLEGQINAWKQKHESLCKSYATQSEEITHLKAKVEELNSQLASLRESPEAWGAIDLTNQDFDLVPLFDSTSMH